MIHKRFNWKRTTAAALTLLLTANTLEVAPLPVYADEKNAQGGDRCC